MTLLYAFVASTGCDHVSTVCLFCTDERPAEIFGHDWAARDPHRDGVRPAADRFAYARDAVFAPAA